MDDVRCVQQSSCWDGVRRTAHFDPIHGDDVSDGKVACCKFLLRWNRFYQRPSLGVLTYFRASGERPKRDDGIIGRMNLKDRAEGTHGRGGLAAEFQHAQDWLFCALADVFIHVHLRGQIAQRIMEFF